MNVSDIMNPSPHTVRAGATLLEVVHVTLDRRVQSLPVVDDGDRYIGTVGVRGLLHLLLPNAATTTHGLAHLSFVDESVEDLRQRLSAWGGHRVEDHLDEDVEPIHPDTGIAEAVLILYRTGRNLPVVERDTQKLRGLVSTWEVLRRLA